MVWENIGVTSFDGPLEALFTAETVQEANKILTDNELPPLVECASVSYASVHVHLQGTRNGSNDAILLRAAELIQTEVDAGRFIVTVRNSTGGQPRNVSSVANRWDGSLSSLSETLAPTTPPPIDQGSGHGGKSGTIFEDEYAATYALIAAGVFLVVVFVFVLVAMR